MTDIKFTDKENELRNKHLKFSNYYDVKDFFFNQLTGLLSTAIKETGYSTDEPLDVLLRKLDKFSLFLYIWKDAYLKEYVFDAEDQREAIMKTMNYADELFTSQEKLDAYIDSHDENCKREQEKHSNDYSGFVPRK